MPCIQEPCKTLEIPQCACDLTFDNHGGHGNPSNSPVLKLVTKYLVFYFIYIYIYLDEDESDDKRIEIEKEKTMKREHPRWLENKEI